MPSHNHNSIALIFLTVAALAYGQAPDSYGVLVNGTGDCLETIPIIAWGRPVVDNMAELGLTSQPPTNSSVQEPSPKLRQIWNKIQMSLEAQTAEGSRLASCAWDATGEYSSIFNCHNFNHSMCPHATEGWLAVFSNPAVDEKASWHFFDWIPGESDLPDATVRYVGTANNTFDPRVVATWFRAQKVLVEETGCGVDSWLGISTARAGTPRPLVQYSRPIVAAEYEGQDELCGQFLGSCATGVGLPSDHGCEITIDPVRVYNDDDGNNNQIPEEEEKEAEEEDYHGETGGVDLQGSSASTVTVTSSMILGVLLAGATLFP